MTKSAVGTLRLHQGWVVVAASAVFMFTAWNCYAGFGVFLPVFAREFGWSRGAISTTASLNLLMGAALVFGVGAATDRYGPRPILALSGLVLGCAYFLSSGINALWQLYLLLGVLTGVGNSPLYLVPTATVSRWFMKRGLALGVLLAGLNSAIVTAGPLSAFLINTFGWRAAYLVIGGLVWAIAVPASWFTRLPSETQALIPRSSPPPAVAGATFREAFRDHRLWFLSVSWLFMAAANMMVTIHIVPYVKDRGVSLEDASLALTIFGISLISGRLLFGALADRLGTKPTFWVCALLQLLALTWVVTGPPLVALYLLIAGFGMGSAGTDTVVVKATPEVFGLRALATILAFTNIGWRCGAALGPAAAGFIYDATGSYTLAFALASAGLAVSFACFALATSSLHHRPLT